MYPGVSSRTRIVFVLRQWRAIYGGKLRLFVDDTMMPSQLLDSMEVQNERRFVYLTANTFVYFTVHQQIKNSGKHSVKLNW